MTPEERLRQTEILLETAARYINRHDEAVAQHDEAVARHDEAIAQLNELSARLNTQMLQLVDLFTELSAFTRQNSEEIRRIWEYLQGQQGNGRTDRQ